MIDVKLLITAEAPVCRFAAAAKPTEHVIRGYLSR